VGKRWRAYFELLRFPAVFTAVADVTMGWLVTRGSWDPWHVFALLVVASSCLYLAGMVLNDVFDADVDARERPERPIPSGRIPPAFAQRFGWTLLLCGMLPAWLAATLTGAWRPAVVGTMLAVCVVLYDAVLKRTPAAPLVMGVCRTLNVLLGMSLAASAAAPNVYRPLTMSEWGIAAAMGIYVLGITLFARTEAVRSSRWRLLSGVLIMFAGALAAVLCAAAEGPQGEVPVGRSGGLWIVLLAVLPLMPILRTVLAVLWPDPRTVQFGVRGALRGIIWLDFFAAALSTPGSEWALFVLFLLVPMAALEWCVSTT